MIALGLSPVSAAAAGLQLAIAAGNTQGGVDILRSFSIDERLQIGVEAIENGADVVVVNQLIKSAAVSPVEVKATQAAIEMAPEYIRRKLSPPWYTTTTFKVVGLVIAGLLGASLYKKRQLAKPAG